MKEIGSKKSSISLDEEWAELSAELCGPRFIKSLGDFIKSNRVQTLLECACGDGHVLNGISKIIRSGVGIDSSDYFIRRAQDQNSQPNLIFKKLDVLRIDRDDDLKNHFFDAVIMRGNSISSLGAWGTNIETFNSKRCEQAVREALIKMWGKIRDGGLLYLDVARQEDIDKGSHDFKIDIGEIHLVAQINLDIEKKRRDVFGDGMVNGKAFSGGSSSYLINPKELKDVLVELLHPMEIWSPNEVKDSMYKIICARK